MCRSIKVLRRSGEVTTTEELQKAALQFVKKISGFQKPSRANQAAFDKAVSEIAVAGERLLRGVGVPVVEANRKVDDPEVCPELTPS